MIFRKTPEEKEQKQLEMSQLEIKYEQFLAEKISAKRNILLSKYPELKTLFEGWIYGVYVAILDHQQTEEQKGKLYYLFENIPESDGKYKLNYNIANNNCTFNPAELKNFPKSYLSILKRNNFDLKKEKSAVNELITAHSYKLDESCYIHYADYNTLNNNIKNLIPLDKDFFLGLSENEQKGLAKPQQYIPEKYISTPKKKAKDIIKMEYRACDLYFNHKIAPEKIAVTLRNRLNKADIQRVVKLYPYFKKYNSAY